ncbi:hypothetical protein GE061_014325 [Apolygus lucorum]|uniref:Uncharacterized protein n=1 Tax=Apolygus lucorum TaxID=248454 RepID=A0A8S9XQA8_APOLU|nr:hypothetical protein GE061_014325 [Apolygus lucorum]
MLPGHQKKPFFLPPRRASGTICSQATKRSAISSQLESKWDDMLPGHQKKPFCLPARKASGTICSQTTKRSPFSSQPGKQVGRYAPRPPKEALFPPTQESKWDDMLPGHQKKPFCLPPRRASGTICSQATKRSPFASHPEEQVGRYAPRPPKEALFPPTQKSKWDDMLPGHQKKPFFLQARRARGTICSQATKRSPFASHPEEQVGRYAPRPPKEAFLPPTQKSKWDDMLPGHQKKPFCLPPRRASGTICSQATKRSPFASHPEEQVGRYAPRPPKEALLPPTQKSKWDDIIPGHQKKPFCLPPRRASGTICSQVTKRSPFASHPEEQVGRYAPRPPKEALLPPTRKSKWDDMLPGHQKKPFFLPPRRARYPGLCSHQLASPDIDPYCLQTFLVCDILPARREVGRYGRRPPKEVLFPPSQKSKWDDTLLVSQGTQDDAITSWDHRTLIHIACKYFSYVIFPPVRREVGRYGCGPPKEALFPPSQKSKWGNTLLVSQGTQDYAPTSWHHRTLIHIACKHFSYMIFSWPEEQVGRYSPGLAGYPGRCYHQLGSPGIDPYCLQTFLVCDFLLARRASGAILSWSHRVPRTMLPPVGITGH